MFIHNVELISYAERLLLW